MPDNIPHITRAERRAYEPLAVTMTLAAAQEWVNVITALPQIVERYGALDIEVNPLTGMTRDVVGWSNNMRPEIRLRAAGRQFRTILHECCHQFADVEFGKTEFDHGPEFARTHIFVAGAFLGPQFRQRLREAYVDNGVVF